MSNKDLPAMPIRLRKDWSKAKIGHCECGHHGSIVDGLCADCHDVEYQQEREQVLIDRIIELQSQGGGLTKREMFAMNAPDMPDWYRIQNRNKNLTSEDVLSETELADYKEYHRDNYGYERYQEGQAASARYSEEWSKHNCRESMRVFTEWRWHYADMMLEGE